ncbi:hypothetical protein SUGI_0017130 [Cryptomeria japonica]|uniref:probable LRR receptor-like serine/threonine-protein kinase At1g67720 n=1 Tax=Cryptomeria japonica TaxID=3369 RepID=UPI002408A406|nr:probable LRR receptor-like serine/threonine-protein kinase At1g67720 [Cryptomeria japonica]GLJ05379.1 hypothetical protein SUGI_0017130 [Cryptomeria japonica]
MDKYRAMLILTTNVLMFLVIVSAQPGFLSINCGGGNNYTDSVTNLTWSSDVNYIDVGEVANISNSSIPYYLQSLRYFPKPLKKSCYSLPLKINVPYLLRLRFLFGNYNGIQTLPSFNVSLETQGMLIENNHSIRSAETPQFTRESIITSSSGVLYVCLIRISDSSDPFISAIELRSLSGSLYETQVKPGIMLSTLSRYDLAAQSSDVIRYPQDRLDRLWSSDSFMVDLYNNTIIQKAHSNRVVLNQNNVTSFPPTVVMQTAVISKTTINRLRLILSQQNTRTFVVLYFAEVEVLNGSEARNFNVMVNEQTVGYIDYALQKHSIELAFSYNYTQGSEVVISLETIDQPGKSSRGPLINAIEYYRIVESKAETYAGDVNALLSIKRAFGIKGWISDPCFGIEWTGIRCSTDLPVRVLNIDLSERNLSGTLPGQISQMTELRSIFFQNNNLSGTLPLDLCSLTKLQIIRLENNYLTGSIPDCLSQMSNLQQLNLENNNFSGVVPEGLVKNPSLNLSYSGNPYLCLGKDKCQSKRHKVGTFVKSTIGVVVGCSVAMILFSIWRRRHNSKKLRQMENINAEENAAVIVPNPMKSRSFSLEEMMRATKNLSRKIGEGGFGRVYLGKLQDGKDVAVKLLSSSSKQGATEFLNEIDLLSRLNHKNLVSLLGYCNDSKQLMLVYDHMPFGSLKDHLYGSLATSSTLDWKTRLRVALDAAEGIEYLHVSCTPKIIHRDVKSSNILLNSTLRGKVADFGLSKIIGDDSGSHVTTTIKGSVGYLDPEYFHTSKLTERSDVYSFGVVLLEIICGRKPIALERSEEELSLVKWVMLHVEANEESGRHLTDILDKRLRLTENDFKSFYDVLLLSTKCIQSEASKRPTISEIVTQIRGALNSIKPEDTTKKSGESVSPAEYSCSVIHVGR